MVWVAYEPALDNRFVGWDDPEYVLERPEVLKPTSENKAALWRSPVSLNYHPLTMLTLAWNSDGAPRDRQTGEPSARPFIRTNVMLHALNTLLVFVLLLGLSRVDSITAAFCAMVFALHPLHVESVAWVSERKDVLYVFFLLAAAIAYQRWRKVERIHWYALSLVLFLASCLSKAMAVVLPVLLLLIDAWENRSLTRSRPWLEKLPYLAISLFFGLLALDIQKGGDFHGLLQVDRSLGNTVAVAEQLPYSTVDQVRFACEGLVMYLVRFFAPTGLSTLHPYPAGPERDVLFFFGPVVLFALVAWALLSLRKGRQAFFGLGWFLVSIALVLQFIPVGRAMYAERYTYLAYIGIAFLVACGIERLLRDRPGSERIRWGITGLVAMVFLPLTRAQVDAWQDTGTLFRQVITRYPTSPDAYASLGGWFGNRSGKERNPALIDSAGHVLQQGVRAGAASAPLFEALATYHGSQGRADSALVWFDRAVALGPVSGQLLHNRAIARLAKDPAGSVMDLDRAIAMGHAHVGESYALRGRANNVLGRHPAAVDDLTKAIQHFHLRQADLYAIRAASHQQLGDTDKAIADAQAALQLAPDNDRAQAVLRSLGR